MSPTGSGVAPADADRLVAVLEHSQRRGFLGPGPVWDHIERALDMLEILDALVGGRSGPVAPSPGPGPGAELVSAGPAPLAPGPAADAVSPARPRVMDLGSGGGVPGLPLLVVRPDWRWVLLDGSTSRGAFLTEAVDQLGRSGTATVVASRAEEAARDDSLRAGFDLVVTRSFGPPSVTAECGAAFLRTGGHLVVAEPPGGQPDRWPAHGLEILGLTSLPSRVGRTAFQVLKASAPCPDRYPRRVGIPAKRPLF